MRLEERARRNGGDSEKFFYWSATYGEKEIRRMNALLESLHRAVEGMRRRRKLWGKPVDKDNQSIVNNYIV
jgi:hypothetical protein